MNFQVANQDLSLSLIDRLLYVRGIIDDKQTFLNSRLKDYREDPFLLNDMKKGVNAVISAIKNKKMICIFGDYDVDGVTSSYILFSLLHDYFNYKKVKIMFPDRLKDGYGLKKSHLDTMKQRGFHTIITVDNGIASIEEARYAKELGLDLIITDHHQAHSELPEALAVINPQISEHYNFKGICGAGVVYKFINALLKESKLSEKKQKKIMNKFLPLVAIATVADCVPLIGENRAIVKRGLHQMSRREDVSPSLHSLLDFLNISGPIKSHHIGFIIGPRINAGGRLATGYESIKTLLLEGEKQLEALRKLDTINDKRKKLQKQAFESSKEQIDLNDRIHIVASPDFHQGVVGIVAGKLTEKYYKPSVVLTIDNTLKIASGSLRGPDYFDVMAMLQRIQEKSLETSQNNQGILIRFGGHKQAGGMTISLDHLDEFSHLAKKYVENNLNEDMNKKTITIDTVLASTDRCETILDKLQLLEPYGVANEEPLFILYDAIIKSSEKVGKTEKGHLKVMIEYGGKVIEVLYRSKGDQRDRFIVGEYISIVGKIKFDHYKKRYFIDGILIAEEI